MLIEAASTRIGIDLLQSLGKYKMVATNIKVSYMTINGTAVSAVFATVNDLVQYYTTTYGTLISARKDPFTLNRNLAQLTPIANNGILIANPSLPVNDSAIPGLCALGDLVTVESFNLESTAFNYDMVFICYNVSGQFKILQGKSHDLRKEPTRTADIARHQDTVTTLITNYQTIIKQLQIAFNILQYVNLCYVEIGYVRDSLFLYNLYFAIVKRVLNTGLDLSVLQTRYLKKN